MLTAGRSEVRPSLQPLSSLSGGPSAPGSAAVARHGPNSPTLNSNNATPGFVAASSLLEARPGGLEWSDLPGWIPPLDPNRLKKLLQSIFGEVIGALGRDDYDIRIAARHFLRYHIPCAYREAWIDYLKAARALMDTRAFGVPLGGNREQRAALNETIQWLDGPRKEWCALLRSLDGPFGAGWLDILAKKNQLLEYLGGLAAAGPKTPEFKALVEEAIGLVDDTSFTNRDSGDKAAEKINEIRKLMGEKSD
ncbi:MAG: hypothetical protein IT452_20745 [Planctomycetia bacterium]|nr:hypothetical protein [Planctomycetia bacterium]